MYREGTTSAGGRTAGFSSASFLRSVSISTILVLAIGPSGGMADTPDSKSGACKGV